MAEFFILFLMLMNFYVALFAISVLTIKLLAARLVTITFVYNVRGGQDMLEKEFYQ